MAGFNNLSHHDFFGFQPVVQIAAFVKALTIGRKE
jgi:hypothetical protein